MRTIVFSLIFFLISVSIAGSINDCEDPNFHSLETLESSKLECGPAFKNRCRCFRTCYDGHHQYVVNCTGTGFQDTSSLAHLPNETQVLIFTGNELEELPWNVFGTLDSLPYLKVIDMSNNKIREIRGKAYHHVQHVERLILDFNELSLDPARNHPRVFSNFISLLELHLTDAFEDGPPRNLASTLHDIFVNSNLTQLIKLHLEQNEISEFRDVNVFCDLPNLLDLHLGDNDLNALHFNLSCLHNLRFLDLRRNKFTRVLERDLHTMDNLAKHDRNVTVDFSINPFECSCKLNPFIKWIKKTKVFIRNKANLQCYKGNVSYDFHETKNCAPKLLVSTRRGTTVVLCFLSMVLIALVCALVYLQRTMLQKKIEPVLDSVSKRVRYTSIANGDTREDVSTEKMPLVERLRLDEIVSSYPELGPTVPDGGYSWFVLLGVVFIQITVPSVLSMYGIVRGYLITNDPSLYFDLWSEVTLAPLLFVAFWSLADPWTKAITDLASIPRLVGIIGVALLTTGVIASGYLATGGVGAYLAGLSAGAVMGIGASFVIVESEIVLRKHFRVRLPLALTLKNIAMSVGFTLVPALTQFLLAKTDLKTGLLLMAITFVPTALGTLILRFPTPQRASPYRLLLTDEDNELGIRISSDRESEFDQRNNGTDNIGYDNSDKQDNNVEALFSEVNSIYTYQEADEDVELFVNPIVQSDGKWKQEFHVARYFKFWVVMVTWTGMKSGSLFFWILVPSLFLQRTEPFYCTDWVTLLVAAGIGSFIPSIASYWFIVTTTQYRRIYFGGACWLSSIILLSLSYTFNYYWFLTCSLFGGVGISTLLVCQDLALCDVLGNQFAHHSYRLLSTIVGLSVLAFCFVHNENICLRIVALLQFLGGCYWIVPPIWEIIRAGRLREG
ncbi:Trophoblast glycoprotein [Trachymyrmex septentrionalis]|uniref:Trophoblast glycoprotein n=1 Tax=Trachymyrmex septentrionalis TaxID=34720 RepID=A0A195EWM2_9HYME|nr:Trophoblast glycoprotein [Trachymyrmex septentrionalis]